MGGSARGLCGRWTTSGEAADGGGGGRFLGAQEFVDAGPDERRTGGYEGGELGEVVEVGGGADKGLVEVGGGQERGAETQMGMWNFWLWKCARQVGVWGGGASGAKEGNEGGEADDGGPAGAFGRCKVEALAAEVGTGVDGHSGGVYARCEGPVAHG